MSGVNQKRQWTQRPDTARARQAAATRLAIIAAARGLFTEHGYHAVGVRDVTARAGVTRGAFAHHFGDKAALFEAVFDAVERDLIAEDTSRPADPALRTAWEHFRAGLQHYLNAATRPDVQRITLIDGPAVLGWRRWRALEEAYSLGVLTATLEAAMQEQLIRTRPVEPLAHLILGSIMEAALLIAHADDPAQRLGEVGSALDDLLRGLE